MTDAVHLHNGDCLEVMRGMADNSVDLILTDPPYFKVKNEPWDNQWARPNQFLAWLDTVLKEFQRILKPNGSLYLFASPQMATRVELLIAERFSVLNSIRWAKPKFATKAEMFRKSDLRAYFPNWEAVIFAEQQGADSTSKNSAGDSYIAECDALRAEIFEPLRAHLEAARKASGLTREDVRIHFAAKLGTKGKMSGHFYDRSQWLLPTQEHYEWLAEIHRPDGWRPYEDLRAEYERMQAEFYRRRTALEASRRPFVVTDDVPYTDTWHFDTVKTYAGKHPCEKPAAMLEHIIAASSRPDAVVLDAFMGTGSTGIAAVKLGRRFIGIEMAAHHFQDAAARIEAAGKVEQPAVPKLKLVANKEMDRRQLDIFEVAA